MKISKLKKVVDTINCPKKNTVAAYMNGNLARSTEEELEHHILDCHLCREVMKSIRQEQEAKNQYEKHTQGVLKEHPLP